jgi:hypothetical protein
MGKPWRKFEIWRNFKYFSLGEMNSAGTQQILGAWAFKFYRLLEKRL